MPNLPSITEPKRKRHWYQYGLRTFLLLVTLLALGFGWLANEARQQRKAVACVEEMGGGVRYDYQVDENGGLETDVPPSGPEWIRDMVGIDFMDDVVDVTLGYDVSDLTPLAGLQSLKFLSVEHTQVSDLTPLAGLKNLKGLNAECSPIRELTPLSELQNLQALFIPGTQVNDLTPLAELKNLQWLAIDATPVSDSTPLAKMTSLKELWINGTQITAAEAMKLREALPDCQVYWSPPEEDSSPER